MIVWMKIAHILSFAFGFSFNSGTKRDKATIYGKKEPQNESYHGNILQGLMAFKAP